MSGDQRKPTTWGVRLGIGFLSLLLLFAGYYGAYRVALDESEVIRFKPTYRIHFRGRFVRINRLVQRFFVVAYLADRKLRPSYWVY
jgi:hypothetical protein